MLRGNNEEIEGIVFAARKFLNRNTLSQTHKKSMNN